MNKKYLNIVILFILAMISSCTKDESVVVKEVPVKTGSGPSTQSEFNSIKDPIAKADYIASEINRGSIEREEGLLLAANLLDELSTKESATPSKEQIDLITEFAQIIGSVRKGDPLANMLSIVKIKTESVENLKEFNERIKLLFDLLLTHSELTSSEELFVEEYLKLQKAAYEYTFNKGFFSDQIVRYYRSRIHASLKEMSATETFKKFANVATLFPNPALYFEIFQGSMSKIAIKRTDSLNILKSYGILLSRYVDRKSPTLLMSSDLFNSSYELASWAVTQMSTVSVGGLNLSELFESIDNYNALFDKKVRYYIDISPSEYFEHHDKRALTIMRELMRALSSDAVVKTLHAENILPRHPYTKIYFARALMQAQKQDSVRGEILKQLLVKDFSELKNNFDKGIALFGADDSGELSNPTLERIRTYRKEYYDVEVSRHFLEQFTFLNGHVKEQSLVVESIIQESRDSLLLALKSRYDSIEIENVFKQEDARTVIDVEDLHSNDRMLVSQDLCVFTQNSKCAPTILKPGIYVTADNAEIYGDELVFHPLALIYAPGKKLTLKFNKIYQPWIDLSAKPAANSIPYKSPQKIIWPVKKISWRRTEYFSIDSENKYKSVTASYRCSALTSIIRSTPIRSIASSIVCGVTESLEHSGCMDSQKVSVAGNDAGQLLIIAEEPIEGIPSLNVIGGNGAKGHPGFDSPYCTRGKYTPVKSMFGTSCGSVKESFIDFNQGNGGNAGNGGRGGHVKIVLRPEFREKSFVNNVIIYGGKGGAGGDAGECGPLNKEKRVELKGKDGIDGAVGCYETSGATCA